MPLSIFVSYSHQDAGLVQPVVGLLRVTEGLIFHDLDSIKPGRKWRQEIEEALYAAQLIVLFWCDHSLRSTEVKKEYELALTAGKDVLPVLLDTTPLPEPLNEFQWVDFRHLMDSAHRSYRRRVLPAVMVVLMVGATLLLTAQWSLQPPKSFPAAPAASQTMKSSESVSQPREEPQWEQQHQLERVVHESERVLHELLEERRRLQSLEGEPQPLERERLHQLERELQPLLYQLLSQLRLKEGWKWKSSKPKSPGEETQQALLKRLEPEELERLLRELLQQLPQARVNSFKSEEPQLAPLSSKPWPWVVATLVFLLALLTLSVRALATRKARHRRTAATPTDYQQQMAEKLQTELLSRGIGREDFPAS